MTLEPWIEHDKRRGTYVVRWRNISGGKHRDDYSYSSKADAKTRKDIVRQMLVTQSLGKVDLSRSPVDCMEKFLSEREKIGSTRVDLLRVACQRFLNLEDDNGRKLILSMADFTRENLLNLHTSLLGEKLSPNTVQTYMTGCIRLWMGWCMDHKWLAVMPYEKIGVSTPRKVDRFFTDTEIGAFESVIKDDEFLCIFKLGHRCGLRPGERLRIRAEHVFWDKSLEKGELYVPPDDTKTDTEAGGRYAELPPDVYALLPKREGLLFPDWTEQRMDRHYLRAKWKANIGDKVLKNGRVVYKTLYWTRHTYAKRYLERGGSLKVLSDRMGHESIKTTADTYGRLERGAIQDIIVPPVSAGQPLAVPVSAGQMRGKRGKNVETSGTKVLLPATLQDVSESDSSSVKQAILG